ncbi:MAG: hypothetical protein H0V91_03970 [Flavisolibacter sp.]|jgi:hypothetical protein|nr:hypothetical protein [Flavisolibacter sp.]
MENNTSERENEHNPPEFNSGKQNGTTAPTGFEGMNFEQQRGSYRKNDLESETQKMSGRNNSKKRQGDRK